MPILGIIASSFRSGAGPEGAYDSLATVTLGTATSTITFAGIPTGYRHLQIRLMAKYSTGATGEGAYSFAINGTNLPRSHYLGGDGSSAFSSTLTAGYQGSIPLAGNSGWGVSIHDVLDYASTAKNKTVRTLNAWDNNGSGLFLLYSGMTTSTDAVSSITITGASTFAINSSFALYGVK
jgi:hypothetical protein